MVSSTTPPVLHDGWGVRWPALVLLVFRVLGGESVGEQLLEFLLCFCGLCHTVKTNGKLQNRTTKVLTPQLAAAQVVIVLTGGLFHD